MFWPNKRASIRQVSLLAMLLLAGFQPVVAQTATPRAGEGIWGLLRRSGITPNSQTVAEFRSLNSTRLKGGDALLRGVAYRLPGDSDQGGDETAAPRGVRYPIFGSEYELVMRKSDRLAGHVFYVVGGHGGPDPGTNTWLNGKRFTEDEIAYDTALRLARRLIEEGGKVYVIVRDPNDGIRDSEYLPADNDEVHFGDERISRNQVRRLNRRTEIINDLYDRNRGTARSQQVISLHVDAYGGGAQPQIDVHFAYASNGGRRLGQALRDEIRDQYAHHQPGRGYSGRVIRRNLAILKDTKPTAVLVELGNIRHRGDQVRLVKPGNRQALAEWIAEGLVRNATGGRNLAARSTD